MTDIIQIYLERYKALSPEISDDELIAGTAHKKNQY